MIDQPTTQDLAQDDGEDDVHPDTLAGDVTPSPVELDLAPFTDEDPA